MRYINLIILTVLFSVTWCWVQNDQNISEMVHTEIQEEIKVLIRDYIQTQLPTATNLKFTNVWSETINSEEVKAYFKYSFDEAEGDGGRTGMLIDGYARLNKNGVVKQGVETWTLREIQISNNHIIFKEGITLTPGNDSSNSLNE